MDDGRFKSQFESNYSSGFFDPGSRDKIERDLFAFDGPDRGRPIYGYLAPKKRGPDLGHDYLDDYGEVALELKPGVRNRTTVTFGDSYEIAEGAAPSHLDNVKSYSWDWGESPRDLLRGKEVEDVLSPAVQKYVEAQVHRGVRLNDVKSVTFGKGLPEDFFENNDDLLTRLTQRGISFSIQVR